MNRIDSVSNEKIKYAVKIAASSSKRKEEKVFFLEGLRLCRDAALTGIKIKTAFFTDKAFEKNNDDALFISEKAESSFLISNAVADKMSLTENSQGFYCLCEYSWVLSEKDIDEKGKYIALENVRDPSNLGAICRTAEALGISGVILSGCCDRYSPKSQRAAMGSLLRLPVIESENNQQKSLNDDSLLQPLGSDKKIDIMGGTTSNGSNLDIYVRNKTNNAVSLSSKKIAYTVITYNYTKITDKPSTWDTHYWQYYTADYN